MNKKKRNRLAVEKCKNELIQISAVNKKLFAKLILARPGISEENHSKKILVIAYDAVGDFILATPVIYNLKKHFHDYEIDVVCSDRNKKFAESYNIFNKLWTVNLNDNSVLETEESLRFSESSVLQEICSESYKYIFNLFDKPNLFAICKLSRMVSEKSNYFTVSYKFKDDDQYAVLSNLGAHITKDYPHHFSEEMLTVINKFNDWSLLNLADNNHPIKVENTQYHLPAFNSKKIDCEEGRRVLFNPFGTQKGNSINIFMSLVTFFWLSWFKKVDIFYFSNVEQKLGPWKFLIPGQHLQTPALADVLGYMQQMNLIITTDTAIAHIATALSKKMVMIRNSETWRDQFEPTYGEFQIVKSSTKKISYFSFFKLSKAINLLLKNNSVN